MKNLENYGVQEMSIKEQKETEGGWFFLALGIGLIIGLITSLANPY